MTVSITIDLPAELEEQLLRDTADLAGDVKEAYAIELFRRGVLDHYTLSQVLGIDRFETDAVLVRHQVFEGGLTIDDIEEDVKALDRFFGTNT